MIQVADVANPDWVRAGLIALALEAVAHSLPVAIELVTPAGQVLRLQDVQRVVELARTELQSVAHDRVESSATV